MSRRSRCGHNFASGTMCTHARSHSLCHCKRVPLARRLSFLMAFSPVKSESPPPTLNDAGVTLEEVPADMLTPGAQPVTHHHTSAACNDTFVHTHTLISALC